MAAAGFVRAIWACVALTTVGAILAVAALRRTMTSVAPIEELTQLQVHT